MSLVDPGVVEVYNGLRSCSLKSFSLKLQVTAILHTSEKSFTSETYCDPEQYYWVPLSRVFNSNLILEVVESVVTDESFAVPLPSVADVLNTASNMS